MVISGLFLSSMSSMSAMAAMSSMACASCFFGEGGIRWAYYVSALFMLLLPLMAVAGFALWIRHQTAQATQAVSDNPSGTS